MQTSPSNSDIKTAIIGISGVGKEYARALYERGTPVDVIVDYPEVLDRECSSRILTNDFAQFKFTVPISGTLLLPAEAVTSLPKLGMTHVFVCTPPPPQCRWMVERLLRAGLSVHVEKPYRSTFGHPNLSLGHLYLWASRATSSVLVVAPTPPEAAWRWRVGKVPILWDLGLHAVGLLGAEEVQALTAAEYANQKLVRLHGGHTDVEVRYSDVGDCTTVVDGSEQDWTAIFDRQLEHVLDGSAVRRQVEAFEVECAIHRLEDECESS